MPCTWHSLVAKQGPYNWVVVDGSDIWMAARRGQRLCYLLAKLRLFSSYFYHDALYRGPLSACIQGRDTVPFLCVMASSVLFSPICTWVVPLSSLFTWRLYMSSPKAAKEPISLALYSPRQQARDILNHYYHILFLSESRFKLMAGHFTQTNPEQCEHYARFIHRLGRRQADVIFWGNFCVTIILLIIASQMYTK